MCKYAQIPQAVAALLHCRQTLFLLDLCVLRAFAVQELSSALGKASPQSALPDPRRSGRFGRSPFTAKARSTDSFTVWHSRHFTAAQLADPSISGPTADPEGDNLDNVEEYLVGGHPLNPDPGLVPIAALLQGHLMLTYRQRTDAGDLSVTPEVSAAGTDTDWLAGHDYVLLETLGGAAKTVTNRATDRRSATNTPAGYLRLRIALD